jgi:ABC-type antimicrobial peptide transport system permease subunit
MKENFQMMLLEKLFNWMLIIGLALMVGRLITLVFMFLDIPFTTFFKEYSIASIIVLIIGLIGSQVMKEKKS